MSPRIDGRELTQSHDVDADVVVVGSGPAGCAVAKVAAAAGARVVVLEAGPWVAPEDMALSAFGAMSTTYRDLGASVVLGPSPMPYVQGRMVGGSSPINGAICWRMPRDVYDDWVAADPALGDAIGWAQLEAATDAVELRLGVAPTDPAIAGRKNRLMAAGAEALGLAHRPTRRNVVACEGLGRCLQGCPKGRKRSVDATLLADAMADGAQVISSTTVDGVLVERGRAVGVQGRADGGARVRVRAGRVVLAASAVQTPVILLASGLRQGPVGEHFQCHPGVSIGGRFPEPVRSWEGATQGHEVTGLRAEGLKLEVLGFGPGVLATRLDGVGSRLAQGIEELDHWLDLGAAVKAQAHGRVRRVLGRTVVTYRSTPHDIRRFRRGLRVMGEILLAAGAEEVSPGVTGVAERMTTVAELEHLELQGPSSPRAYKAAITHMMGSARMGSDPATSVVRTDFRHHAVEGLYVADSSVFPTNLGVNPQVAIMALATLAGERVVA